MYPTLTHFIEDLFGIHIPLPIQTYGFFVAMAFLAAGYFMYLGMKRYEKNGLLKPFNRRIKVGEAPKLLGIISSGLVGFIIGFKLVHAVFNYSSLVENPQEFVLSGEGSWWGGILFFGISAYLHYYEKQKSRLETPKWEEQLTYPHDLAGNIVVIASVSGILGAKLFHNLENIDDLISDPLDALLSFSGLSFYGGLVCGAIAVIWYAKKNNIPALMLVDILAPALALAYALGRTGCHVSGDGCWGLENLEPKPEWLSFAPDWMWAYDFPNNVINAGVAIDHCAGGHCRILETPVFPTSFYEASIMFTVFLFLWTIKSRIKIHGLLFSIYLVLAGFERFFIEKIRVNNVYHIFGNEITQAEIIASISILLGIFGIVFFILKHKKSLKELKPQQQK